MNSLADTGPSARRDSAGSLHRLSSGSFSAKSAASPAKDPIKDLEKFTKYFLIKTVQVIVQSRIATFRRHSTESKPSGNDWFNLNIKDLPEVTDKVKRLIEKDGFSMRSNWRICCEISLKARDGGRAILEHWIISHRSLLKNYLCSLNNVANNRSLNTSTTKGLNNADGFSISGANFQVNQNSPSSPSRARTSTISGNVRTRLNSIDDNQPLDDYKSNDYQYPKQSQIQNNDLRSSTSCYSLSRSSSMRDPMGHEKLSLALETNSRLTSSRIVNSATSNSLTSKLGSPNFNQSMQNNGSSNCSPSGPNINNNNSTSLKQQPKTLSTTNLSSLYNRMTLLLKTIMTTSHIVPAYQLATGISDDEMCEINYRLYVVNPQHNPSSPSSNLLRCGPRGSMEDILNSRRLSGSPNRPGSASSMSSSPVGSMNIREFVSPHELDHFCPIINLGSAKCELNELDVSLTYRNDVKNSSQLVSTCPLRETYGTISDRDCITAAKQLLAGNENISRSTGHKRNILGLDDTSSSRPWSSTNLPDIQKCPNEPLKPAFASETEPDPSFNFIEPMFESLLRVRDDNLNQKQQQQQQQQNSNSNNTSSESSKENSKSSNNSNETSNKSESFERAGPRSQPIDVVPAKPIKLSSIESVQNASSQMQCGSTPKSLTDSFVFVELNPPFASDEQSDINSFFHGPAPHFNDGTYDSLKDADELSNQLAVMEADALEIDEFVDNICVSEDDERGETKGLIRQVSGGSNDILGHSVGHRRRSSSSRHNTSSHFDDDEEDEDFVRPSDQRDSDYQKEEEFFR